MDTKSLTAMYYAFYHSYINYGIIAWRGVYKNNTYDSSAKYTNKNLKNHTQKLFRKKHALKYKTSIYFGGPTPLKIFNWNTSRDSSWMSTWNPSRNSSCTSFSWTTSEWVTNWISSWNSR